MINNKNQKGGGYYAAVGEGMIAGMPLYKGYHDMTPPLFKGELLNTSLKDVSCPYTNNNNQSGGKKRKNRKYKNRTKKNKKRKSNNRKSKKNKRKRTKKRTYRK